METGHVPTKSLTIIGLTAALLFILLLPVAANINFMQNDDWVYYRQVGEFLKGNFVLDHYIETTFYTQGLMATLFVKIFGMAKLPVLTLLVSVANYFIVTFLIRRFYLKSTFDAVISGLTFFWSPIHIYSVLGFMSDNYFIFFTLLTFLAAQYFLESYRWKNLFLFNTVVVLGFFVRQLVIFSSIALIMQLILNKRVKCALVQSGITLVMLLLYFFVFPLTSEMQTYQAFDFVNLINVQKTYSNIYLFVTYGIIFILPFLLLLIGRLFQDVAVSKPLLVRAGVFGALLAVSFILTTNFVKPQQFNNQQMYYLGNTVNRNGFYSGVTVGASSKYSISYETTIYKVWDITAKISVALVLVCVILIFRHFWDMYAVYAAVYIGFMCIMQVIHDRYLLVLTPVFILCLLGVFKQAKFNAFQRVVNVVFLTFMIFYSYNFMMDFFLVNWNMWHKANLLVTGRGISPSRISAGYAWQKVYKNTANDQRYIFSFDSKAQNPKYVNYTVIDTIRPIYPLSFFQNPVMYLYRKNF